MSATPPVYVINLDRSVERLARITGELNDARLPFRRVPAVDGGQLARSVSEYDEKANRKHYLAPLTPGEIACVLSHREVWRLIDNSAEDAAIVLEDDAGFGGDRTGLLRAVAEIAESSRPELLKLYDLSTLRRPEVGYRRRHPLLPALTTTAQALNRSAAKALLEFTEKFYEPADVIIQRWWDHGVCVTSVTPSLFSEVAHRSDSTIRQRGAVPLEGRLLRELRRPFFQARRLSCAVIARARAR